ncbi:MAG: superoxide dismutase family protein [Alphaproteobacteria bacterium]|nr:superoxide dismutase family protein [Alphaproteobacteria bacterium]NCQ87525.1 superoxide dismutase family protein [Alphaproteobacteria bacterium]NCT06393.1 superoxide dismutase family protein [Alphaproteobacteria bacterium]
MKFRHFCLSLSILALSSLPVLAHETADDHWHYNDAKVKHYLAVLINDKGEQTGSAVLIETPKGVLMTLKVEGFEGGGEHAIHFHEKADCTPLAGDAKGAFTNSGGHYNPDGHNHGYHDPQGAHAGDMPNLIAHSDGTVHVKMLNTFVTLGDKAVDGRAPLFDADGSALIIHHGADDYHSQPTGDAGGRFACGVITNQEHAQPMAQKHDGAHDHGAGHEGDKDKSYMQVPMSIE